MIQPGREHHHAPELAPVLVWIDVVGVIGAGPVVTEMSNRLSRDPLARDHAERAIVAARGLFEQVVEVIAVHRPRLAVLIVDGGPWSDDHRIATQRGDVVLRNEVAESV